MRKNNSINKPKKYCKWRTCFFFFLCLLFLRGLWASELELKLLPWPVPDFEDPLGLKSELLLLFEVLLEVEISCLCINKFWPEDDPNLVLAETGLGNLFEARGGGIKALAEICFYKKKGKNKWIKPYLKLCQCHSVKKKNCQCQLLKSVQLSS